MLSVVGPVGVGRHNAHHGQGVQQGVVRANQGKLAGHPVDGPSLAHAGQIGLGRFPVHDAVDGKGHVLGRQRHAVGEGHIVADDEGPGEAILGTAVVHGQVVHEVQVVVRGDESGLDERLVHVLAGAPAQKRVESRRRLRGRGHGHDHLALPVRTGTRGTARRRHPGTRAARQER